MKKIFQAKNISCGNCVNLIKVSLEDMFGEIKVNLESDPKEVSVEITNENQESKFKQEMRELGFEIVEN